MIYFFCDNSQVYKIIYDCYLFNFIKYFNFKFIDSYDENIKGILIFCTDINEEIANKFNGNKYLLNTEQLTCQNHKNRVINNLNLCKKYNINIIDYSYTNKKLLKDKYNLTTKFVLEPFYLNNYNYKKDINCCGLINNVINNYRIDFKNKYLKNIDITNFAGKFSNERLEILKRSKILINVHAWDDYKVAEIIRIYEAISCKCIVISEKCVYEELNSLKDYIFFIESEKMEWLINEILNKYDRYYFGLYGNKNNSQIFEKIFKKNKNIVDNL